MTTSNKDDSDITGGLLFFVILTAIPAMAGLYFIIDGPLKIIAFRNSYFKTEIKIDSVFGESSEGEPLFYGIGRYDGIEGIVFLAKANEDDGLGIDSIKKVWIRMYDSSGTTKLHILNRDSFQRHVPISHLLWKSILVLSIFDTPFFLCLYFYLRSKRRQRLRKIQNQESEIKKEEISEKLDDNEQSGE